MSKREVFVLEEFGDGRWNVSVAFEIRSTAETNLKSNERVVRYIPDEPSAELLALREADAFMVELERSFDGNDYSSSPLERVQNLDKAREGFRQLRLIHERELNRVNEELAQTKRDLARADEGLKMTADARDLARQERDNAIRVLSGVMGGNNRAVDAAVALLRANPGVEWP